MTSLQQSTVDFKTDELILHYYADASVKESKGLLFEDDGEDRLSIEQGKYHLLNFHSNQTDEALLITLNREGQGYEGAPEQRQLKLVVHGIESASIKLKTELAVESMNFDRQTGRLELEVLWDHTRQSIQIEF